MPRAFLVRKNVHYKDANAFMKDFTSNGYDPREKIYIEEAPISGETKKPGTALPNKTKEVSILEYSPNEIKMKVIVTDHPWLFFSDTYYPGWKAWVDKAPTKIYRANYAFRALYLTPGEHEIVWKYDPILFKIGGAITLLTATWLLFYYSRRRIS